MPLTQALPQPQTEAMPVGVLSLGVPVAAAEYEDCLLLSRLFRAAGAGHRRGGLTGRGTVALATPLLCNAETQTDGSAVPCGTNG